MMRTSQIKRFGLSIAILVWLGAAGAGLAVMHRYNTTPGAAASPASHWPADTKLTRASGKPTIVMLAHPQCPCTEASLGELARVLTKVSGKATAYVVFVEPKQVREKQADAQDRRPWEDSKTWDLARAIPGVTAVLDPGCVEVHRFGATTSGHVVVYDAEGALAYSGGITDERGHAGDNPGEDAVVALISGKRPLITRAPILGCPLEN